MALQEVNDWNGRRLSAVQTSGGVWAFLNYADGLVHSPGNVWPPAELVQKLNRSDRLVYFREEDRPLLTEQLGYYADLQSAHSEDAIVWSYFGTLAHSSSDARLHWYSWMAERIGISAKTRCCDLSLWRRVPHPDNLTPGGPEIDVLILTDKTVLLFEIKWRSAEGRWQGVDGRSTQMDLRDRFLTTLAPRIFPGRQPVLVYVVLDESQALPSRISEVSLHCIKWKELCCCGVHPFSDEILRFYDWKRNLIPRKYGATAPG